MAITPSSAAHAADLRCDLRGAACAPAGPRLLWRARAELEVDADRLERTQQQRPACASSSPSSSAASNGSSPWAALAARAPRRCLAGACAKAQASSPCVCSARLQIAQQPAHQPNMPYRTRYACTRPHRAQRRPARRPADRRGAGPPIISCRRELAIGGARCGRSLRNTGPTCAAAAWLILQTPDIGAQHRGTIRPQPAAPTEAKLVHLADQLLAEFTAYRSRCSMIGSSIGW
jgi:hypothetical protein